MLPAPQSAQEWPHYLPFPGCFLPFVILNHHQFFFLIHFLNSVTSILTMWLVSMIFHTFPMMLNQRSWIVCEDYCNNFLIGIVTSNLSFFFQSMILITITLPFLNQDCITNSFMKCLHLPSIIKRVKYKLFSLSYYLKSHPKPHYISNFSHQSL